MIYIKGFNFYKSIIEDLTEESELILIFLQLNSGASKEILNNKTCYKITMLSVEEIKEHLIKNIPQFFFVYNKKSAEEIAISDSKTQIIGFNEEELFPKKNNNYNDDDDNDINNKIMNIVISLFHEGGHQKYHMNINLDSPFEPVLFINRKYEIKDHNTDKIGESGVSVDLYLYNFFVFPSQILIHSSESYQLMNKDYFTGKLNEINMISNRIITNFLQKNNLNEPSDPDDIDALNNINKFLKKENNEIQDNCYLIIN